MQEWSKRVCDRKNKLPQQQFIKDRIASRRFTMFISFVEVYNNYIYDLLEQPEPNSVNWRKAPHLLRHDSKQTVYVHGASEVGVKDADQAMQLFLYGVHNRKTASTLLNQCSSRSHSVFTIKLVSYHETSSCPSGMLDVTKLAVNQFAIVDLAGVERSTRTKATGFKLAEASNINNSLLTLRNCFEIMRHNQTSKQPKPIPYRDHKLTTLLKSFFEMGRAQIRMIVCVKPSKEDLDDNVQVLSFGKKAQAIMIEQQSTSNKSQEQSDSQNQSCSLGDDKNLELIDCDSSSSIDLFKFTLTRFKISEKNHANGSIDRNQFVQDIGQYLQANIQDFENIVGSIAKISKWSYLIYQTTN